jgi:hypothetical protein
MIFTMPMSRWTAHAPKDLRHQTIRPIPCKSARVVVTIEGKPYAGFYTRECAEEAVRMWSGQANGGGTPMTHEDRERAGWPAVRGLELAIVEH